MNTPKIDSALLYAIAEEAGKAILEIYHHPDSVAVMQKEDRSPLTQADLAAHKIIAARLASFYPEIPLLSEEGKEIAWEERCQWELNWCVDPLDGTKEFIKRNGEFTVNIALIHKGEPVWGIIHAPELGVTAWGGKGTGAYYLEEGKPIQALDYQADPSGQLKFVVSRSHMTPEVEAYLAKFANPQSKSSGSSLKFLLLATGEAQIYPRLAPTMEWDTAAGQAILEAAGGQVIDQQTGLPMRYNRQNLRNNSFIAVANGITNF